MGLLDSIIGSVVGGNGGQQQKGGANPLVGVLMSLLAARTGSGGLGGMLGNAGGGTGGAGQGGLGGLLGGGGAAGGLGALIEQFTQAGHGGAINSWIGNGQNQPIAPHDLGAALGPETVGQLSQQTGMGSSDLLSQLSQLLPGVIDQLTPQGRMPTEQEHAHW
ncbi:YidB family protein [Methylobacterium sp. J-070]|uniref:YidB family protein n=1 Tax=Methylobacterium sp. J-070 TaxID=2836650 RepID=UPI001FB9F88C|nr:YidB family protein [Methylobacterium sp. J-070]MCJ2049834.1 YidB family protein [Methylobacterium sp. J-070]